MGKKGFADKMIIVSGVTASGKTGFAIEIAHFLKNEFNIESEIVNADSVQLYDELKIIAAHPTIEEQQKVKHNLFGVLSPFKSSSVAAWLDMARTEIQRINNDGKIAIICGGTGFYIDAIINGIASIPEIPEIVRKNTRERFNAIGRDAFFEELSKIDAEAANRLHKNNTQRILRAYEVVSFSGKSLSEWWKDPAKNNPRYNILALFVLLPHKEEIHKRSYLRIIKMIQCGAIEEAQDFLCRYPEYSGPLSKAIGFKEICKLLNDQHILEKRINALSSQKNEATCIFNTATTECIDEIYANTKKYIKRQSTWFRYRLENAKFLYGAGDNISILSEAHESIKNIKINF